MDTNGEVRTLCVNCIKYIPDTEGCYLVLEQNMTVISVINEWISPQTVTGTDFVCESCFKLALEVANIKMETSELETANSISLETDPLKLKTEPPSSDNEEIESNHFNSKEVNCSIQSTVCMDQTEINTSCDGETVSVKGEDSSHNEYTENNESHGSETNVQNEQSESGSARNSQDKSEKELALRRGCLTCKRSIMTRQSTPVSRESPTNIEQLMIDMIHAAATREITVNDRICYKCWQKMKRHALKKVDVQNAFVRNENIADVEKNKTSIQSKKDPSDSDTDWVPPKHLSKNYDPENPVAPKKVPVKTTCINLHNYKRAKNTNSRCIFHNCEVKTLHTPKQKLRIELLMNHNYYLPQLSKICSFHLVSNNWDLLSEGNNSPSTFTTEHIEDIFSLLKTNRLQTNFDDVLSIDEHLLQYWIGMTKEKFLSLVNEVPEIQDVHRGLTGLAGLLIKRYRRDTDERLSRLMQIPRRTLEGIMRTVKDILNKRGEILEAFLPLKTTASQPSKQAKQPNKNP